MVEYSVERHARPATVSIAQLTRISISTQYAVKNYTSILTAITFTAIYTQSGKPTANIRHRKPG